MKIDDNVQIKNTTDASLDGKRGVILGVYSNMDHEVVHFIVGLDAPYNGNKAIVIQNVCMDVINES